MDEQLKDYLDDMKRGSAEMETRIIDRIGGLETRFGQMETRFGGLEARVGEMETRIMDRVDGRIDAVEDRLKTYIAEADHDLETKIITEFYKWGRTSDIRTRQALSDTTLLKERMLAVEDRISALERAKAS